MNPFILLNDWLFNKTETEREFIIRWADVLVINSTSIGIINTDCFAGDYSLSTYSKETVQKIETDPSKIFRNKVTKAIKTDESGTIQLDPFVSELLRFRREIESLLLNENFITLDGIEKKWFLTERGRLMKELGGYHRYKKYRESEIKLITNQGLINGLLITATALAAIMPFLAAWLFSTKVYNTNVLPPPVYRPDIRIDSVWLRQQVDDLIQKRLSNPTPTPTTTTQPPR